MVTVAFGLLAAMTVKGSPSTSESLPRTGRICDEFSSAVAESFWAVGAWLTPVTVTVAVVTAVARMVSFLPGEGDTVRVTSEKLWQTGFRETYSSEFRTERPETIAELYRADPQRYDAIAAAALRVLDSQGQLAFEPHGATFEITMPERARRRALVQWRTRKAMAKALYFPRLLKSAATFGDWLPYALWKLKRHTGVDIEPTERQRRHPLIWGWPVLFRLLREQSLR